MRSPLAAVLACLLVACGGSTGDVDGIAEAAGEPEIQNPPGAPDRRPPRIETPPGPEARRLAELRKVKPFLPSWDDARQLGPISPDTVVGTLTYGIPSGVVAYDDSLELRAFRFHGTAGEVVRASVTGVEPTDRAVVWIAKPTGETIGFGEITATATLPSSGEWFVVFRDADFEQASFRGMIHATKPKPPPTHPGPRKPKHGP
ncbi:MAG: hypothetical protein QM702_21305 [Rubrivivax sp.]